MKIIFFLTALAAFNACSEAKPARNGVAQTVAALPTLSVAGDTAVTKIIKTEVEWKAQLTASQYDVLREKGTERAFTGAYHDHHEEGVYRCAACDLPLFASDTKFESGTGWPSFFQPIVTKNVQENTDQSYGMKRVEVVCARCDGHLGHVFDDGPKPTGLRYCINSVSLRFDKKAK